MTRPATHVDVFLRLEGGGPEVRIGSVGSWENMPVLLRAVADNWDRRQHVESDDGDFFAVADDYNWGACAHL